GVDQLTIGPGRAVRLAQPTRTATTELARAARVAVVVRPHHAERGDRAARARRQRAAEGPLLVELEGPAQLELVAGVVERHAIALVDRRVVVVLHQVRIVVTGVRIHRPFDVAFALGQDVA